MQSEYILHDFMLLAFFQGPLEESTVTGHLEPKEAPAWKRRAFRYLVSFPIIGMCLLSVFIVMFLMLRLQVIKFYYIYAHTQRKFMYTSVATTSSSSSLWHFQLNCDYLSEVLLLKPLSVN